MRIAAILFTAILAATPPIAAQTGAAATGWRLGVGVEAVRFAPVAVSDAAPGVAAEVRPSGRAALHLAVARSAGSWSLAVEAGWAEGHIEAGNDAVSIRDLTAAVSRYRLALAVGRTLVPVATGALAFELAPTLDRWSVSGDARTRGGLEGRLVLRVPLGALELEHRLGLGVGASPIEAADIGEVSEERGLRTLSVGLGLRARL
jgi:hypothetical protein